MSDSVRPYGQQTTRLCPRDSLAGILEWFAISFSNRIHKHKLSRPLITSHLINKECRQCDGVSGPRPCQCHHRDRQQLDSTGLLPWAGWGAVASYQRSRRHLCSKSRMTLKRYLPCEFENYQLLSFLSWFLLQGSWYHFSKSKSYSSQTGGPKWNLENESDQVQK